MEAIAKELWTMSDQVGPAESVTNVMPKPKMQRCLVYWVDERLVSIEPVSSVVGNENAKEDAICNIKWKGKGPYRGRIVKISADKDVLKSEQKKLEEQLVNLYSEQPDETEETTPKSISQRGRKRKLKPVLSTDADQSPKKSNASTQPSSSQHDRPKSDSSTVVNKPLKKGKNPISEAKLRLEAKVASQKALFSELIPAPCPFSGLDGVARAIEVVNNPSVDIVNEDMYIQTLETAKDTELSRLKSKVQRLTVLVEERDKEIVTLKTEAKEKTCQKCHGSMFGTKLAITPDNIRFLSELVAELSGNSGYSDSYLPDLPPAEPNTWMQAETFCDFTDFPSRTSASSTQSTTQLSNARSSTAYPWPSPCSTVQSLPSASFSEPFASQFPTAQPLLNQFPTVQPSPSQSMTVQPFPQQPDPCTTTQPLPILSSTAESLASLRPMQSSPPISQPPSSHQSSPQQESLPVEATLVPLQPATDCQNEKEGMIQLVKPFDVWVKVADYMAIRLKGNKGLSFMLNKALSILFSLDELRSGCAVGGRPRAFNKENDAESVPLDNNRLSAIKAFLTSYCDRMETKTKKKQERLTEKDINSIINTKCSGARRKYKQLQTK